jgi:hypothetical protein
MFRQSVRLTLDYTTLEPRRHSRVIVASNMVVFGRLILLNFNSNFTNNPLNCELTYMQTREGESVRVIDYLTRDQAFNLSIQLL